MPVAGWKEPAGNLAGVDLKGQHMAGMEEGDGMKGGDGMEE